MDPKQMLRDKALKLLSLRPRSSREIKSRLRRFSRSRNFPKNDSTTVLIEKVIEELTSANLINDEEFCRWWIQQRIDFRPKSKKEIFYELLKKGIDKNLIAVALKSFPEKEMIRKLLAQKTSISRSMSLEEKRKIFSYLKRRGFPYGLINSLIDEVFKKR